MLDLTHYQMPPKPRAPIMPARLGDYPHDPLVRREVETWYRKLRPHQDALAAHRAATEEIWRRFQQDALQDLGLHDRPYLYILARGPAPHQTTPQEVYAALKRYARRHPRK